VAFPTGAPAPAASEEPPTEPINGAEPSPPPKAVPDAEARRDPFAPTRFRFMTGMPAGETARIRDDDGRANLSYRSFASVVGIVAALTAAIVLIAGFAATAFLFAEHRFGAALVAVLLSIAFALLIAMLVPPTTVTLYDGQTPALTIAQDSRASFPMISFAVVTPDGIRLARIRRSFFSRIGRNRWRVFDPSGNWIAEAVEESLGRALVRKFAAKFSRRYDADVRLMMGRIDAGRIVRRDNHQHEVDVLELPATAPIDRRVAVAVATLVLGSEP